MKVVAKKEDFETADAPPSFKRDAWEHFGFPVPRIEGEKATDKKQYADTVRL